MVMAVAVLSQEVHGAVDGPVVITRRVPARTARLFEALRVSAGPALHKLHGQLRIPHVADCAPVGKPR
jgi:hypothetical protein